MAELKGTCFPSFGFCSTCVLHLSCWAPVLAPAVQLLCFRLLGSHCTLASTRVTRAQVLLPHRESLLQHELADRLRRWCLGAASLGTGLEITPWLFPYNSHSILSGLTGQVLGGVLTVLTLLPLPTPPTPPPPEGLVGCPHLCGTVGGSLGGDSSGCMWSHCCWCPAFPVLGLPFWPLACPPPPCVSCYTCRVCLSLALCLGGSRFCVSPPDAG